MVIELVFNSLKLNSSSTHSNLMYGSWFNTLTSLRTRLPFSYALCRSHPLNAIILLICVYHRHVRDCIVLTLIFILKLVSWQYRTAVVLITTVTLQKIY